MSSKRELLLILLSESFAFTVIPKTGIGTLGGMNILTVPAVCAVFLSSNLAQSRLSCRARFVDHPVLELVPTNSVLDYDNFFLWQSDGLAASRANVTAHGFPCPRNAFRVAPSILRNHTEGLQSELGMNLDGSLA